MSEHHTIKITVEPELVTGEFSCTAPVGADCRLGCGEQCAAHLDGDPCGHDRTHDEGFCLPITWLQEDDMAWYESYDGTLTEARSGPIVTRWDGDYYVWTYLNGPRPDVAGRCPASDLIADLREVFDMHPLSPSLAASVRACVDAAETRLQGVNDE